MSTFIAFCENKNCGTIFQAPRVIGGSGSATIHMTNTRVGPCPNCGQLGIIPDGIYEYAKGVVSFLTGPSVSIEALKAVKEILEKSKYSVRTKEEVLKEVEKVSPDSAEVLKNAPYVPNYIQWLQILIMLVMLAIQVHTSYFKKDVNITEKFIEYLLKENEALKEELKIDRNNKKQKPFQRKSPKIHRNAPCPCGSGKKFKKCCLDKYV